MRHWRGGGDLSGEFLPRQMGQGREPYKLPGAQNGSDSTTDLSVQVQEQVGVVSSRQRDSGSLHQQRGGDQIQLSVKVGDGGRSTSKRTGGHFESKTHSREVERPSGSSLKNGSGNSVRMEPIPKGFRLGVQTVSMGQTRLGSVCQQDEFSATQVCFPVSRPTGLGDRCEELRVTREPSDLCVPTSVSVGTVSSETTGTDTVQGIVGPTVVTSGEMVTSTQQPSSIQEVSFPDMVGSIETTPLGALVREPRVSQSELDMAGERRMKEAGFSQEVVDRVLKAHASSTHKQYKSKWISFTVWAEKQNPKVPPDTPSITVLSEFLTHLFNVKKLTPGSISNYKSAILFHWNRSSDVDFPADHRILKDLMKGFKRDRPRNQRKVVEWDLKLVLDFFRTGPFKNWEELSDKDLTIKTVFLLSLASGSRRGELHALTRESLQTVHGDREGRSMCPDSSFVSKTHLATGGLGALKEIFIPSLNTEEEEGNLLCPVKSLDEYVRRSDQYRSPSQKQLFIPWLRGCVRDIKAPTISGYIKCAVLMAYKAENAEELVHVVPHSVRHVATSLQAVRHFSLDDVLGAGRWTSPNTFITHYLQNFSTNTLSGLSGIKGGFVAGGSSF